LFASWARGEPERGAYAEAELLGWRRAAAAARRRGAEVWVVAHAGALPDWQIARGGWLDPDALANWGCWVDRLAHTLTEVVAGWFGLWDPLGEAAWYGADARRVARLLLDAQAAAHLQLHRGSGALARQVGVALTLAPPAIDGVRGRALLVTHLMVSEAWVRAATTGRVGPPFALTGELPNGTGAVDVVGIVGDGRAGRLGAGKPLFLVGEVEAEGAEVIARIQR
jgi:hypothetical protein